MELLKIKIKKMKHQLKDLYMNKDTPMNKDDQRDTFTGNFNPSGGSSDIQGDVGDLRRELNMSLAQI